MNGRIVNLEVNDSGAWRRVSSFDLDTFEDGQLEYAAQQLLELSNHKRLSARISIPGDTKPLMYWSRDTGWQEVKAAA